MDFHSMRSAIVVAAMLSTTALSAQTGQLDPRTMPRIGQVDERFQSYSAEMSR